MNEIERAVSRILEQDNFDQADFGDEGPDENDKYWAMEFKGDWDKGGIQSRGTWYPFRSLADALRTWIAASGQSVSQGFLLAVRELFKGDVTSQATIDHLLSRGTFE